MSEARTLEIVLHICQTADGTMLCQVTTEDVGDQRIYKVEASLLNVIARLLIRDVLLLGSFRDEGAVNEMPAVCTCAYVRVSEHLGPQIGPNSL